MLGHAKVNEHVVLQTPPPAAASLASMVIDGYALISWHAKESYYAEDKFFYIIHVVGRQYFYCMKQKSQQI